jgi:LacI family transcriptional regulator
LRNPTIRDVAERAKVSVKTVSRVINREASVLASTQERVLHAIAALNYQPNQAARNLRSARAYAMGLVYDNPNPYYIIGAQNGVLSACREAGFGLQIHPCDSSSPDLLVELTSLVRHSRLAGLVLAPPMSERKALIDGLAAQGIPFVRIISAPADPQDGYPCVYVDDRDAAYDITKHLIQLGHRRIGFIWGGTSHRSSSERYLGYERALKDYGLALDRKLVIPGDYSFDDGFRGARKLLALREPPTAIFGSNDEIAAGVLAAAKSSGIEVPFELSIAGFEDSPFSRQSWPALTTANQATADIARQAALLLLATLQAAEDPARGAATPINPGFSPVLVVRGSTAPARIAAALAG